MTPPPLSHLELSRPCGAGATRSRDNFRGERGGEPSALLLLLLDSRAPAGGHNHSAGMEPAIAAGWVRDLDDVEQFCRGRLASTGRVAAAFAYAACRLWHDSASTAGTADDGTATTTDTSTDTSMDTAMDTATAAPVWDELDAEFEARTPSEAVRAASRQLGRGLLRLVRAMQPDFIAPWSMRAPHHPIMLGAAVAAAGGTPELAARAAALNVVSAPASGAVRLLGLDPFATQALLARLAREIDRDPGILRSESEQNSPSVVAGELPADSALALDLLADFHLTTEVRLFAS